MMSSCRYRVGCIVFHPVVRSGTVRTDCKRWTLERRSCRLSKAGHLTKPLPNHLNRTSYSWFDWIYNSHNNLVLMCNTNYFGRRLTRKRSFRNWIKHLRIPVGIPVKWPPKRSGRWTAGQVFFRRRSAPSTILHQFDKKMLIYNGVSLLDVELNVCIKQLIWFISTFTSNRTEQRWMTRHPLYFVDFCISHRGRLYCQHVCVVSAEKNSLVECNEKISAYWLDDVVVSVIADDFFNLPIQAWNNLEK